MSSFSPLKGSRKRSYFYKNDQYNELNKENDKNSYMQMTQSSKNKISQSALTQRKQKYNSNQKDRKNNVQQKYRNENKYTSRQKGSEAYQGENDVRKAKLIVLGLQKQNQHLTKLIRQKQQQIKKSQRINQKLLNIVDKNYRFLTREQFNQVQKLKKDVKNLFNADRCKTQAPQFAQSELSQSDGKFIQECEAEINRLKNLVFKLQEQNQMHMLNQLPSEKQQIKDRIIMKLEDQLITAKLLLKEERQKNIKNRHFNQYGQNKYNGRSPYQYDEKEASHHKFLQRNYNQSADGSASKPRFLQRQFY